MSIALGLRYAAVGLLNTAFGFACIAIFVKVLGWQSYVANAAGFAAGFFFSFMTHRSLTFRSDVTAGAGLPRFLVAVSIGYAANLATLYLAKILTHLPEMAAQLCGVLVYLAVSFIISKEFVFARTGGQ